MDEILELLANPQHFLAWVRDHDPSDVVGYTAEAYCCPVANWLSEETGLDTVGVDCFDVTINYSQDFDTPVWVARVVEYVDSLSDDDGAPVYASQLQNIDI